MVKLFSVLSNFHPVRLLVIGDFMLDSYTRGKVKRISPEAPVPVLHVEKEEFLPGGAGNVALNLISLGANVSVIGRIAFDRAGEILQQTLLKEGINVDGLLVQKRFQTPVKNRLISDSQQLMRIDFEDHYDNPPEDLMQEAEKVFLHAIDEVDAVAISDYGKGFLTRSFLRKIIDTCREKNKEVVIDPKGDDFSKYRGCSVLKPNLSEAYTAAKLTKEASLDEVGNKLLEVSEAKNVLITRSENGISIFYPNQERMDFPVRSKEVLDVTGAGDTVLAMIAMALANKLDIKDAAQLANIAAGIAIERLGCARVTLADMSSRLLEFQGQNKVFDEEHLFALQQVLMGKRVAILGVESREGITSQLFRTVHKIAEKNSGKVLIVYVRDDDPDEEFVMHLSTLTEVDFIILHSEGLKNVCELIHPNEVFSLENEGLISLQRATDLLTRLKKQIAKESLELP